MPNYCQNHLIVKSNDLIKITAIYNAVIEEKLLQYLVPYSADIEENSEKGYNFRLQNWGVKQDIYTPFIIKDIEKEEKNGNWYFFECHFLTAWNAPVQAFNNHCNDENLQFQLEYVEFGIGFAGFFDSELGHKIYDEISSCTKNDLPFFYDDIQELLLNS